MEFIDLKQQYCNYQNEIDRAIKDVLMSGHYIMGGAINDLEEALARQVGTSHCISTSSGTDSLLIALQLLNIQPGDEVICPPYTWVSPIECIVRLKAKPVFVDIDPNTCVLDANQLEDAITEKTKAIIAISLYGQMPDFRKINAIASKYNLPVLEDGAQSFGAAQDGIASGAISTLGVTSFFPTKVLGCYGDGGAIFTNNHDLAEKAKALRVHGAPERYNHQYVGMNGRMDTLQAAILLAKLPFLKDEIEKRREVAYFYDQNLKDEFITPNVAQGNTHVYSLYVLQSEHRLKILQELKQADIPHGIYYPICIHEQPAYRFLGYKRGDFPVAERVSDQIFSIPMHPWLTEEQTDRVVTSLKSSILQIA